MLAAVAPYGFGAVSLPVRVKGELSLEKPNVTLLKQEQNNYY